MNCETIVLNRERNVLLEAFILSNKEELSNIQKRPAVIILPGGGYNFHSEREAEPVALAYMAQGYNAYILRYSVAEHAVWPNQLDDLDQAIGLIRKNAAEWQTDPQKICTIGFSAGGHLSLAGACLGKNKPNAQILGYPVVKKEVFEKLKLPESPDLLPAVTPETSPTFIFASMTDEIVSIDNSIDLIAALQRNSVVSELHIFRDACHGQSLSTAHISNGLAHFIHPEMQCWFEMSMAFLNAVFGEFPKENPNPHWRLIGGGLE